MTTSATIAGVMTVSGVIQAALEELGILSAGEQADGDDLTVGMRALNWMLKSWAAEGINLWREQDASLVASAGQQTVTLDPRCFDVIHVSAQLGYDRPLVRWEAGQYRDLPNKLSPGQPTIYVVGRTPDAISLTFWPVPIADTTINYTYARIPDDVTDGNETLDLPPEWSETIYINLAARLAAIYGATRTDGPTTQLIVARAQDLKRRMDDADRAPSLFMGSDHATYF